MKTGHYSDCTANRDNRGQVRSIDNVKSDDEAAESALENVFKYDVPLTWELAKTLDGASASVRLERTLDKTKYVFQALTVRTLSVVYRFEVKRRVATSRRLVVKRWPSAEAATAHIADQLAAFAPYEPNPTLFSDCENSDLGSTRISSTPACPTRRA